MTDRETPCSMPDLPDGLTTMLKGYRWSRNRIGESGASVYRLDGRTGHPDLYVKHGHGASAQDVVEEADFDDERAGWTAGQVWDAMAALLPLTPDAVVTHGDFSLDNLILRDGEVAACIDVGRAGVADRYQDLAILWSCLGEFGPILRRRMFARYGIAAPDEHRLRSHVLLDELF